MNVAARPQRLRRHLLTACVFAACAAPLLQIAADYRAPHSINKLDTLLAGSGEAAMILLLIAVAVTPARALACRAASLLRLRWGKRLSDWNWLVRLRRMFGLWCFCYASVHFGVYFWFDQAGNWRWLAADLAARPFIAAGAVALLALVPLAATSTDRAMRRLGRRWKALQRCVYVIAALALAHVWLLQKSGETGHLDYAVALAAIAAVRLALYLGSRAYRHDDGLEADRGSAYPRLPSTDAESSPAAGATGSLPRALGG